MFIQINTETYRDQYALYTLTDIAGVIAHVGVVPFAQLTALLDVPDTLKGGEYYLSVIRTDEDKLRLGNHGVEYIDTNNLTDQRQRLVNDLTATAQRSNGKAVTCDKTGETFMSAADAARKHDLTYTQLIRHLQGQKGFKSVKGNTYYYAV